MRTTHLVLLDYKDMIYSTFQEEHSNTLKYKRHDLPRKIMHDYNSLRISFIMKLKLVISKNISVVKEILSHISYIYPTNKINA